MTGCSPSKCLISVVSVFVFLFLAENAFHYCPWMHNLYVQTAAVWRPLDQIQAMAPWIIGRIAVTALLITCLYKKCMKNAPAATVCATTGETKKCCPVQRGLCFGVKIGLLMGVINAGAYAYLPIPLELAIGWLIEGVIQGIGAGLILSFLYIKKDCGAKECNAK